MFRSLFCGVTALIATVSLYFFHVRLKPADLPFYRKLVQESIDLHAHSALEKAPVRQTRQGVRKDIWTIKEGARLHGYIESVQSDMTLRQKKGKMEAIELLQEIEASLDMDGQMRHLKADSGICYFPSCRMEARNLDADFEEGKCAAKETHFFKDTVQLLGTFQIEHPLGRLYGEKGTLKLDGLLNRIQLEEGVLFNAARVPFSISSTYAKTVLPAKKPLSKLSSEKIEFWDGVAIQTVSEIRALGESAILSQNTLQLFPKEESVCSIFHGNDQIDAKEIRFNRSSHELLCISPHGRLTETRTLFDADAGRAKFVEKRFQPQTLFLEGNVRIASHLQGKESFAMADSATFHINQKKIALESSPCSRVLFRQEGLEISAPLVHIREAIQGFGDVRFFFYPEEQNVLETIFSKYL